MSNREQIFNEKNAKRAVLVSGVLFMIFGAFAYGASMSPRSTILVSTVSHYSAESYEWLWDYWMVDTTWDNGSVSVPVNPVIASLKIKCDAGVDLQLNISQNTGSHYVDYFNWTALVVAWGVPTGGNWYSIGPDSSKVFMNPNLDNEPAYDDPFSYHYDPIASDYSVTNSFEIIVVMFGNMTDHVGDPWMHHEWYITTWRA